MKRLATLTACFGLALSAVTVQADDHTMFKPDTGRQVADDRAIDISPDGELERTAEEEKTANFWFGDCLPCRGGGYYPRQTWYPRGCATGACGGYPSYYGSGYGAPVYNNPGYGAGGYGAGGFYGQPGYTNPGYYQPVAPAYPRPINYGPGYGAYNQPIGYNPQQQPLAAPATAPVAPVGYPQPAPGGFAPVGPRVPDTPFYN